MGTKYLNKWLEHINKSNEEERGTILKKSNSSTVSPMLSLIII